jgi:regulation of enolase protein 1 (concanavalin A-like superfamily)
VVYTIESNGDKKYVRVVMEMDGSDWKITNFRTSDDPLNVSDVN